MKAGNTINKVSFKSLPNRVAVSGAGGSQTQDTIIAIYFLLTSLRHEPLIYRFKSLQMEKSLVIFKRFGGSSPGIS